MTLATLARISTVCLLLASLLESGCAPSQANNTPADALATTATPILVEVVQPHRGDVVANYRVTSTIESDGDAAAIARFDGEVVEILVEEGARVHQGQLLARLDGEKRQLQMRVARANLEQAQREFDRNKDLATRGLISKSALDGLKFDLGALQATYDLSALDYEYANIRAPIAGVVSARLIRLGQTVKANDPAFQITDTHSLLAYLQVPQTEISRIQPGQGAALEVDSMPGKQFPATIIRISPTIDEKNGTFRATAAIDNSRDALAPGMFARFTIAYNKHRDALLIPQKALLADSEATSVYVVHNGEAMRRDIETGIASDTLVEVLSGLSMSDSIIVTGHANLRNGSKVLASSVSKSGLIG